jgi:hypothetical protein
VQEIWAVTALQVVVARAAVENIVCSSGDQPVRSVPPVEFVLPFPAHQAIRPTFAAQSVITATPEEDIRLPVPDQSIGEA